MNQIGKDIIKRCLQELSDKSYQERVWTADSGPEISSLTEATCQLFGGSGLDSDYQKGLSVFGEKIDDSLKAFGHLLEQIPDDRPPSVLIEDERMLTVRAMAAEILALINRQAD